MVILGYSLENNTKIRVEGGFVENEDLNGRFQK